jgi:DNA replication protein DnaC
MQKGKIIRYVIWPDLVKDLNSAVNDFQYNYMVDSLKRADVLYIDDFLKGNATEAEARRAFDVINARYNIPSKKTIISSERSLNFVADIDTAIAGRINQRSRGFYIKTPNKDWRLSS